MPSKTTKKVKEEISDVKKLIHMIIVPKKPTTRETFAQYMERRYKEYCESIIKGLEEYLKELEDSDELH